MRETEIDFDVGPSPIPKLKVKVAPLPHFTKNISPFIENKI